MSKGWVLIAMFLAGSAAAQEEGGIALQHAGTDISNTESLQRGARNFMNYCSGCHSLKYLRYNRLAADLKIPESELGNLMFTTDKSFETINSATVSMTNASNCHQMVGGGPRRAEQSRP